MKRMRRTLRDLVSSFFHSLRKDSLLFFSLNSWLFGIQTRTEKRPSSARREQERALLDDSSVPRSLLNVVQILEWKSEWGAEAKRTPVGLSREHFRDTLIRGCVVYTLVALSLLQQTRCAEKETKEREESNKWVKEERQNESGVFAAPPFSSSRLVVPFGCSHFSS
jgi:hypothetical protein